VDKKIENNNMKTVLNYVPMWIHLNPNFVTLQISEIDTSKHFARTPVCYFQNFYSRVLHCSPVYPQAQLHFLFSQMRCSSQNLYSFPNTVSQLTSQCGGPNFPASHSDSSFCSFAGAFLLDLLPTDDIIWQIELV
jgi:hypothetical protein